LLTNNFIIYYRPNGDEVKCYGFKLLSGNWRQTPTFKLPFPTESVAAEDFGWRDVASKQHGLGALKAPD
jgi:hypothetical protein